MTSRLRQLDPVHVILAAIVALGFLLRVYGLNWDQGLYLHPDERFIAIVSAGRIDWPGSVTNLLDPAHSSLNPRRDDAEGNPESFAYGTLPLYVQSSVSWAINGFSTIDYQSYQHLYKVGRVLNVLLDTLTILLTYLLAARVLDRRAGVLAAALYALAVLPIQLSHFFTVDVWLNCFVTAALLLAVRLAERPSVGRALALGVPVGCAFATKASVPALLLPLAVASGWAVWRAPDRGRMLGATVLAGVVALVVFTLFEPYALVRREAFIQDIRTQARIVRGQFDVPFTRQFVGLTPGLYELRNLFRYSVGPGFLLAALAGVAFGARRAFTRREPALLIVLAWVVAYVPTLLITEARFLRYALPLLPSLAVLAAGLLAAGLASDLRRVARVATTLVLVVSAVWAIGFATIYARENPRLAASKWMANNVPPGAAVTAEAWDDALPLPYPGAPPLGYRIISFDVYGDLPPEEKAAEIATTLQTADYVVLSSDRVKDSVDNLPWRYAVQNEYYRRLLAGQLGFQLVYDAELRPELFGYRFDDSGADESFTVYDHPHVRIFRKVESLSTEEIRERLLWGVQQPWEPQRYPSEKRLLLGEPVAEIETASDAGWNAPAVDHSLLAVLAWLLAVEAVGLAVLPLVRALLPRTPDRGAFSARLLGLLLLGWISWFAGSLRLWDVRSASLLAVLALLAVGCWSVPLRRRLAGGRDVPIDWRAYAISSGVWLGLFGYFLLLRALYPDFWQTWFGGEKPFELAYLRAVAASTTFPPYDPWYADGIINYYYYGWHLVATLTRLSGVGVSLGFQLASATFAALLGLQAASLGATLLARGKRRISSSALALGGALALTLTLFAGNLDPLRQLLEQRGFDSSRFDFWRSTRVIDYTINEFPYFSQLWADLHPHVINLPVLLLLLSLLVQVALAPRTAPLRSFWPVAAAGALVLGTASVTNSWDVPLFALLTVATFTYAGLLRTWRHGLAGAGIGVAVVVGAFALFIPFFRGFYSVVQGISRTSTGSSLGQSLTVWGVFFGIAVAVVVADLLRRERALVEQRDGFAMAVVTLASATIGVAADLVVYSDLPSPQVVVAALLAAALLSLAAAAQRPSRQPGWLLLPLTVLAAGALAVAPYRPAATLVLAVALTAALYAAEARRRASHFVPWALVAVGCAAIAGTEFIYIADDLQQGDWERMNTVFKFYLQAWLLLAVGTSVLLAGVWRGARVAGGAPGTALGIVADTAVRPGLARAGRRSTRRRPLLGAGVVSTVLLAIGLLYPLVGTPVRLDWDMPSSPSGLTLDGYAWMDGGTIVNGTGEPIDFTGDLAAIAWLNANVDGTPVILEAAIGPYRGNGGRISSATGLPAVIGWDRHQRQQRYEPGINQRMQDVRAIYNEADPARKLELLRRYRVRYVVVGDVERLWNTPENPTVYASAAGLDAFDQLTGDALSVVFDAHATRIYVVHDFPALPPAAGAVHDL